MTNPQDGAAQSEARADNGHPIRAGERTVTARFADFGSARTAIDQLEVAGLEGATMAFDEASLQRAAHSEESGARDERFIRRAVTKLTKGGVIGMAVGAVAGLVVGLLMFADGPTAGLIASVIAATAAGGGVGVALGGIWTHRQSPAWEETFEAPDAGDAVLHVRITSDEEHDLVCRVLAEHDGDIERG